MIPSYYQQGFNTNECKDFRERVDISQAQEITESGVYTGILSGGFLQDYQSNGTAGTRLHITFTTDDNALFSKTNIKFLVEGKLTSQAMQLLTLAQDPFGQKGQVFPRITEGEKNGKLWYKLEDADGLRVTLVLLVSGQWQSKDGAYHPQTNILGIFDGNGHSPEELRTGRKETVALNSRRHWLKQKILEQSQGGYVNQPQAQPQQNQWQASQQQQGGWGPQPAQSQQQWNQMPPPPTQQNWQNQKPLTPTQSLDMAVQAQQRAMNNAQTFQDDQVPF